VPIVAIRCDNPGMAMFGPVQDGRPIENGISASAVVVEGNSGFSNLANWTGGYRLRVRVPGRDEYTVGHWGWIAREKQPVAGFGLPVMVSPVDPGVLRVEWDDAPTIEQRIAARDPAILDPENTWRRVAPLRFVAAGPSKDMLSQARDMIATYLPEDSVLLKQVDDASRRGDPSTYETTPWQTVPQPAWPPAPGTVPPGRTPALALVVSASVDPHPFMRGESFIPPGPRFASRGGSIQCSRWQYLGWLLLCVLAPGGSRYGVYLRTQIRSRHLGLVLPVTIGADDPRDVEVEWDAAPNIDDAIAARIDKGVDQMTVAVTEMKTMQQSSVTAALANVDDPQVREQLAQMWSRFGVDTAAPARSTSTASAPPPPAAPQPTTDLAADLTRLQRLRDSGVLTDAEYQHERAKLLNTI
jgi:hypothetical protein